MPHSATICTVVLISAAHLDHLTYDDVFVMLSSHIKHYRHIVVEYPLTKGWSRQPWPKFGTLC